MLSGNLAFTKSASGDHWLKSIFSMILGSALAHVAIGVTLNNCAECEVMIEVKSNCW
jgi:hypothetical protein